MSDVSLAPAGWYPNRGVKQWWDGSVWGPVWVEPGWRVDQYGSVRWYNNGVWGAVKPRTNHILHLLLTVFTGGLWLPVWIIVAIANR